MPEIRSDIGARSFSTGNKFTVGDESAEEAPQQRIRPEDLSAARKQKIEQMSRPSENAKRRVEMLLGIGRAHKDVVVDDGDNQVTYSIRTLKGVENKHLTNAYTNMAKTANAAEIYDIRALALSFCVYAIDGNDIDLTLGCSGSEVRYDIRQEFFNELDEAVAIFLYKEFEALTAENKQKFGLTSDKAVKEVAQDIKKSGEGA